MASGTYNVIEKTTYAHPTQKAFNGMPHTEVRYVTCSVGHTRKAAVKEALRLNTEAGALPPNEYRFFICKD